MAESAIPEKYTPHWLDRLDGRYGTVRIAREVYREICDDLGGESELSMAKRILIQRAVWLHVWMTQREQEMAEGGDFDPSKHSATTNALTGVLNKLGLERRTREISLQDFIKGKASA